MVPPRKAVLEKGQGLHRRRAGPGAGEVVPGENLGREGQMEGRGGAWRATRVQGQMGRGAWNTRGVGGASRHRLSAPHQEERVLSGTLEASKALLEEQLEAAQERCARLHETQRENLLLRTRLGEAHAVRPLVTQ